jgi:hypothetical protein
MCRKNIAVGFGSPIWDSTRNGEGRYTETVWGRIVRRKGGAEGDERFVFDGGLERVALAARERRREVDVGIAGISLDLPVGDLAERR